MATEDDSQPDGKSLLRSRAPQLTVRFVDQALPFPNELTDRARRLTRNTVDADDLVQETRPTAYTGFNTATEATNLRALLFNGLRRAQHRPADYLIDRQLAARDRPAPQRLRSDKVGAPDALPDIGCAATLVT